MINFSKITKKNIGHFLSNGHSPANLSNSSTRQKFASLSNSSTRQNGHFRDFGRTRYICPPFANYFPRTRYIRPTFANHFPRTRYIRHSIHSPTLAKLWLAFDTFARVIRHFGEFGASGHCLAFLQPVTLRVLSVYVIIRFKLSDKGWPKVITLSGTAVLFSQSMSKGAKLREQNYSF
jgi:hypothetical protein